MTSTAPKSGPVKPAGLEVLRSLAGFTAEELASVDRGAVVAKILPTRDKAEMAAAGVIQVRASKECFVEKVKNIESFMKASPMVLQVGKFSNPPNPSDLERMTLDSRDLDALGRCRIGNCGVKLPGSMIERLHNEMDWSAPDHSVRALSLFRQELLSYVKSYLVRGNSALAEYRDKSEPVKLAVELPALVDASLSREKSLEELRDYLDQYPNRRLPNNIEKFLYWSKMSFGRKPVISISDVTIVHQPGQIFIASRQIYASHYFDGSLGLTAALDGPGPARPGMYLMYMNRSRIDALSGRFGGVLRAILRRRMREGLRKDLQHVAKRVESSCK